MVRAGPACAPLATADEVKQPESALLLDSRNALMKKPNNAWHEACNAKGISTVQNASHLPEQLEGVYPYLIRSTSGMAIASFICGIVSWPLVPLLHGIISWALVVLLFVAPAVIMGHLALRQIKRSGASIKGRGMAITGLSLGYLDFALLVGFVIALILAVHR